MFMMPGMNNTEPDGFAPTYYPGTPNLSEATRVTLKAGQEMTGANFALIVARMARVRGRALNSRGEPASGRMVMLMPADPPAWASDEHEQRDGRRRRLVRVRERRAGPLQPQRAAGGHGGDRAPNSR